MLACGTMQATEKYIRHADQDASIKLYQDFLNIGTEHSVDIVMIPEEY